MATRVRCSVRDAVFLAIAAAATAAVWQMPGAPGAIIVIVVGHFFVFCNVVRLRAALELVWAGAYLVVAAAVLTRGLSAWWTLPAIAPATIALLALHRRLRATGQGRAAWADRRARGRR